MVGVKDLRHSRFHLTPENSSCKANSEVWKMKTKVPMSRASLGRSEEKRKAKNRRKIRMEDFCTYRSQP